MKLWPSNWWPREAWYRDSDDFLKVVGAGPFPLPGERKASQKRGEDYRRRQADEQKEALDVLDSIIGADKYASDEYQWYLDEYHR